jgi:uncharacterized protein (DUF58 family)
MASPRQIRLCREGLYYTLVLLAVLSGAVSRQLNLLMLLGSVMAGPLLFSVIYGRLALRRVRIERRLPADLHAEERLLVDVSVTNPHRWLGLWALQVEDVVRREETAPMRGEGTKVSVFFPRIAARETQEVRYEGCLRQSGRYHFGPIRVSTRFPLGLIRHSRVFEGDEVLLVHPKLGQLTDKWAQLLRDNVAGSQRVQRRGLLEADFYGLRDWRLGDNRRWIHWRTSARRGTLVVRQFEQRRSQDLAVLVDLCQPAAASEQHLENVETAVCLVATIVAEACRRSARTLIVHLAAAEPLHRLGSATPWFFREQMDALTLVKPHQQDRFPRSLGHALALVPPSMPTVLVSTREIDWEALQAAAAERESQVAGRCLQAVNVASDELAQLFHR